jgi:hypothetical protein
MGEFHIFLISIFKIFIITVCISYNSEMNGTKGLTINLNSSEATKMVQKIQSQIQIHANVSSQIESHHNFEEALHGTDF